MQGRLYCLEVEQPSQVVGNGDQAKVCGGRLDAPFGHDMVKAPLPFYGSERVFHQGLSFLV